PERGAEDGAPIGRPAIELVDGRLRRPLAVERRWIAPSFRDDAGCASLPAVVVAQGLDLESVVPDRHLDQTGPGLGDPDRSLDDHVLERDRLATGVQLTDRLENQLEEPGHRENQRPSDAMVRQVSEPGDRQLALEADA